MNKKDLKNRFTYHKPIEDQTSRYESIRYEIIKASVRLAAEDLNLLCPDSWEKTKAITKLEEAVFWANASIARKEAVACGRCNVLSSPDFKSVVSDKCQPCQREYANANITCQEEKIGDIVPCKYCTLLTNRTFTEVCDSCWNREFKSNLISN